MQSDSGLEPYGRFYLGDDRDFALSIWNQLQSDTDVVKYIPLLQMEWVEADQTLPIDFRLKGCTLSKALENTAIITRELFKAHNLGSARQLSDA